MKSESHYDNILHECELIYEAIVIRKGTIRIASRELGIPRSTIHDRIHRIIKKSDSQLYNKIVNQLEYNSLYRSKPMKYWEEI